MNYAIDWNEYFIMGSACVTMPIYFMVRKHFQPAAKITIWLFTITWVETLDYGLASTPFQMYYCGDNTSYEPSGLLLHVFVYPPFSFIFLYFYDKWQLRGIKLICYILVWAGVSGLFEWIYVVNGIFNYTGWRLYYSIPIYPISNLLLIKLYKHILNNQNKPLPN